MWKEMVDYFLTSSIIVMPSLFRQGRLFRIIFLLEAEGEGFREIGGISAHLRKGDPGLE
jgi:hypothetical protein